MTQSNLLAALAELPHFRSLPEELLRRVAESARLRRLRAGELLFTQGEPVQGFYAVSAGSVRLFRTSADGREQALQTLGPGQSFAEAALFSMPRYPASARALVEETELLEIGASTFLPLFREDARVAAAIVSSLSLWLHALVERIEELQIDSAPARLARYLLRLPSRQEGEHLVVALPMAKKDLAAHLALTPETLSRLLRRWHESGVLSSRGKDLTIRDARVLMAIADREEL